MPAVMVAAEYRGRMMKTIKDAVLKRENRPIKVIQFGEGNFLRAFPDYMIDIANEKGLFDGGIAIIKCVPFGNLERFNKQDNLYTVILRGKDGGEVVNAPRIVTSIEKSLGCYEDYDEYIGLAALSSLRFVISNTTEAGIVLDENDHLDGIPETYPGKLTQFLYERYKAFDGAFDKGLIILPVELIDDNGKQLKKCVLALSDIWNLPAEFVSWVNNACTFCSTLVDRIVTGYPFDEAQQICEDLGYTDELLDVAEPFGLWVIESDKDIRKEFPLDKAGMPVLFTDNHKPYKERKVRILNGAHTSTVLLGWLSGLEIVRECMEDSTIRSFMDMALSEIKPAVKLPSAEVEAFTNSVFERFENPFIRHKVLDISLNSVSKWRARVLSSFKDYYNENGEIPKALTFSFAALLAFYSSNELADGSLKAKRNDGTEYVIKDGEAELKFFCENSAKPIEEYVTLTLKNKDFWGEDLTLYNGFKEAVVTYLGEIRADAKKACEKLLKGEI